MPDPTARLAQLRRLDSQTKAAQVIGALDAMVTAGTTLSIAALARSAGVSRRFIYDHPELRAEAERRSAQIIERQSGAMVATARTTTASLRADLANLNATNHRLNTELTAMRRRLGQLLGQETLADMSADETANIAADVPPPSSKHSKPSSSPPTRSLPGAPRNSKQPARSTGNSSTASTATVTEHPAELTPAHRCGAHLCVKPLRTSKAVAHTAYPRKGHASTKATQVYLHADLQLKERALARTAPTPQARIHYQPADSLLAYLEAL